jgi:hypothetical protein
MAAPALAGLASDPWSFTHPEAALLAGIEWRRIAGSAAGRAIEEQLVASGAASLAELLAGTERLLISVAPRARGETGDLARVVIVVEGSPKSGRLLDVLSRRLPQRVRHLGVEILEEPGGVAVAFASPRTLLVGEVASVRAALDQASGAGGRKRRLWQRARELAAAGDVWLVADAPAKQLAAEVQAPIPLDGIEGLELLASFRDELEIGIHLQAISAQRAGEIAGMLEALIPLAEANSVATGRSAEPWEGLRINVEGDHVGLALRLKPDQLAAAIARGAPVLGAGPQSAEVARGEPPGRRNVRIYGLEEGVREVPLGR